MLRGGAARRAGRPAVVIKQAYSYNEVPKVFCALRLVPPGDLRSRTPALSLPKTILII